MKKSIPSTMRTFLPSIAAALALALSAAAVLAQSASAPAGRGEQMHERLQKRFLAADRNGDGRLTLDEAKAGMPRIAEHFDAIDAAHTGAIGLADIERWLVQQRGARRNKG